MKSVIRVLSGNAFPYGAHVTDGGVNFALFSLHATAVSLVIYEQEDSAVPLHVIRLDPQRNRDRFIWHVLVAGLRPGVWFTWRVDGPRRRADGHAFDARRELLDPFARRVSAKLWTRVADAPGSHAMRGQVLEDTAYDWEQDKPLARALEDEVIYELHVGGFTRDASAGVAFPGTFAGLAEKIPWLKSLGITAVELLPVMAFDESDVPPGAHALGLENYWGYSTCAWYALHRGYAASDDEVREFRDLVKMLHRSGIAVILDVVFNHTAEGGPQMPAISFRGIDNRTWYHLDPKHPGSYRDYTGCGNTINCNHPVVAAAIVDCLEYWVREFHVDGFRLDLASVLTRDETGKPDAHARVIWQIEQSPVLRERILIAEPWDAVGLHQVGGFPGFAWSEWNDRYRDVLRSFLRGDGGVIGDVATRIAGSSDLYAHSGKRPRHSVNFVTCHDGFTLIDLVSYERKHNEANGEGNHDGHDHNITWNTGAEGPAEDSYIAALRLGRVRNFVAILLLSQGVPMLTAGDERLRTQHGNNNAYCQNNELSWLDWTHAVERDAMERFVRGMIEIRKRHPSLRRREFIVAGKRETADLHWYGHTLEEPDWHDADARVLCFRLGGCTPDEPALSVLMNMDSCAHELPLPAGRWALIVDTSAAPPSDFFETDAAPIVSGSRHVVESHSVMVFEQRS